jgi:hypothetical protein
VMKSESCLAVDTLRLGRSVVGWEGRGRIRVRLFQVVSDTTRVQQPMAGGGTRPKPEGPSAANTGGLGERST